MGDVKGGITPSPRVKFGRVELVFVGENKVES